MAKMILINEETNQIVNEIVVGEETPFVPPAGHRVEPTARAYQYRPKAYKPEVRGGRYRLKTVVRAMKDLGLWKDFKAWAEEEDVLDELMAGGVIWMNGPEMDGYIRARKLGQETRVRIFKQAKFIQKRESGRLVT